MSLSTAYLINILESKNILDKTIEMNQHFPCSPYYSELQKRKAEMLLQESDNRKAFSHLVDAHCVSLRHSAVNTHLDKLGKKKALTKSNMLPQEICEDSKNTQQLDQCFQFSKVSFPTWMNRLPPEWTVVHISEMWQDTENFGLLGFGPPPIINSLPKLVIARFHGGQDGTFLMKSLDPPIGTMSGVSLLAELKAILEGNKSINKDFRGNRDQYWKLKQDQHDQLKTIVVSLENWWLEYNKSLLIGELSDSTDLKMLNLVTSTAVDMLKKMKRSVTVDEEAWIRLLLSCYHGDRSERQFVRGLLKVLNVSARSPLITELLKYFKTMHPQLEKLKHAKRNPVILVLDKTIQQLPWESMPVLSTTPISRVPSLHFLNSLIVKYNIDQSSKKSKNNISPMTELKLRPNVVQINPNLVYYIINPDQDLPGVQLRLQPIIEKMWGKKCGLSGVLPVEQHIKESLMERDIFLYCGHGSGSKYIPNDNLLKIDCRAAPILMGCSSGRLDATGRIADPTGTPIFYLLAGSPGMVGMLWEVTDVDCDRFTVRLLDLLLGARRKNGREIESNQTPPKQQNAKTDLPSPPPHIEPEILRAVAESRSVTRNFLTGAAAIVYGLPIRTLDFNTDEH